MKIGVFSDAHYCHADVLCGTRRPLLSLSKIREAMDAFCAEGVELCIFLGDLVDHDKSDTKESVLSYFQEGLALIRSYSIPFYFIPGNHDYAMLTGKELAEHGIEIPPYTVSVGGYRLIFLDANYRSDSRRFDVAGSNWLDSNLPQAQCEFLKSAMEKGDEKYIVCIHENLDPFVEARHIVRNAEEVRNILKGKAMLVLQGHYHPGAEHTIDGIPYITLPAMCEGEKNSYRILNLP